MDFMAFSQVNCLQTSTYFWWGGEDGRGRGRIVCAYVFMFSF